MADDWAKPQQAAASVQADDWAKPAAPAATPAEDWAKPQAQASAAPAGDDWAKPTEQKPNMLVRAGVASPESPIGEASSVGDYLGKIPGRLASWWKEGGEQRQAAEEQLAGEKGKVPPKADAGSPLTSQVLNDAMGFGLGSTPTKGATPTTNLPVGRAPGITAPVSTGAAAQVAKQIGETVAKPAADTLEKIFSPTTVGPAAREAEGLIREKVGERAQKTEQARAQLDEFQQLINAKTPAEQNAFVAHVEDPKATPLADPTLQPVADTLRKVYEERRTTLEQMPSTAKAAFIEDYYPHMWKDKAKAIAGGDIGTMQGSGAALKERSIPTLQEGLARGLEPVYQNPLEATLAYVNNMDRFIAHNQIFDTAKASGSIKAFPAGRAPEGWVPLKGRLAETGLNKYYAPSDFARVYNNFISKGFHEFETGGKVYDALRKASNAITMSELGLSAFHATTMVNEAVVSELSNALGKGLRGEVVAGVRKAKDAVMIHKLVESGSKFEKQYLDRANFGPDMKKAVELGAKANMRAVSSRAHEYKGSAQGSFWDAWKAGRLGAEMKASDGKLAQGNPAEVARLVGRTMDTVAAPLFDKLIPKMKNGAFYSEITDWLGAHPTATDAEQAAAARQIWDSIDNRFGELQLDNVFWNKLLKQSLQLMVRAVGWDLGTVREIAGGAIDAARSAKGGVQAIKDLSPRTKYAIALPVVSALVAQGMSYLKTGQASEDPFIYPTGGQNPDGSPEKAIVPGYMKDVVGYAHDPVGTAGAKIATAPKTVWELLTNRDYRDLPIAETSEWAKEHGAPPPWMAYAEHVAKAGVPISIKSFKQKEGSGISPVEALLGMRAAPRYMQEPDEMQRIMDKVATRRDKTKERSDRKLDQQYGQ